MASKRVFVDQRGKILRGCGVNRAVDHAAELEGNSLLNRKPVKCVKMLSRRFGARAVGGYDSSRSVLGALETFDVVSRDAVEETVCVSPVLI